MVVFHEQVLRIIDVMTGCGLAEADLVRRHLSKEGGPERTAPWFRAQALARGFDPGRSSGSGRWSPRSAASASARRTPPRSRSPSTSRRGSGAITRPPSTPACSPTTPACTPSASSSPTPGCPASGSSRSTSTPPPADWKADPQPVIQNECGSPAHRPVPTSGGGPPDAPASRGPVPGRPRPGRSAPAGSWKSPARSRCSAPRSQARGGRAPAGDPLLPPRGQGHQRRRDRPHRLRPALHQPARLLEPRRRLPPGRRAPGPHRRPRLPLRPRLAPAHADCASPPPPSPPRRPQTSCSRPAPANVPSPPRPLRRPPAASAPLGPRLRAPRAPHAPTRRDLLARVGVLARQSIPARQGTSPALDLFVRRREPRADGMADLVPAGELRELDLAERVEAELEILGFDVSQHVMRLLRRPAGRA